MAVAYAGLKASHAQLEKMLNKTGRSLNPTGRSAIVSGRHFQTPVKDKLDYIVALAEQVFDKVKGGWKMRLRLPELMAFLQSEGMSPNGDAMDAISQLKQLIARERARIGQHVKPKSFDADGCSSAGAKAGEQAQAQQKDVLDLLQLVVFDPRKVHGAFDSDASSSSAVEVLATVRAVASTSDRLVPSESGAPMTMASCRPESSCVGPKRLTDHEIEESGNSAKRLRVTNTLQLTLGTSVASQQGVPSLAQLIRLVPASMLFALEDIDQTAKRVAEAKCEVDRILLAQSRGEKVLGDKPSDHFLRIVLLLHPDGGAVNDFPADAGMALQIALTEFYHSQAAQKI